MARSMSELLVLDGPPARSRFRLAKLSEQLGGGVELYAEFVHLLWVASALDDATLTRSRALLRYGPERDLPQKSGVLAATVVPRAGTISPWSSKATDIFHLCGLTQIRRVERGVRWYTADGQVVPGLEALAVDRMTQRVVTESQLPTIFAELPARPMVTVALGAEGPSALQRANNDLGLALSAEEVDYLVSAYLELQRDPTDVELMMFAQANSEHCRHKIFNASWEIDGEAQALSLFAMIRNTHKQINGEGILSAYSDNAAVISGHRVSRFGLMDDDCYRYDDADVHILMKVETHNHPTAIAPYPGAATGSGGEIRDEGAVGRGSKPKAGLTGFTTSHLNIPDYAQPWEIGTGKPEHMVSALDIMLEGPIGAAGFNNEFGRPALAGYFRTFEQAAQDGSGLVRGYHKPVMIAGGVGSVRGEHINAVAFPPQAKVIVLGGPAMLIGLGGGAASSMGSGESRSDLDFASVQRENPEMERRCQEVIDRCCALGDANPILLIHDVGAGGLSNALPELVSDAERGGNFALRAVPNADPGMTPLEIWCNESQERYVMAVAAEDLELFAQICDRERCPFAVVGEASEVQRLRLSDAQFDNNPVDIPLSVLFGKPPKMQRSFQRGRPALAALDTRPIELDHAIEQVLRFPAVASKHFLITIGDRSITGLVAREQMVGPWQVPVADAHDKGRALCVCAKTWRPPHLPRSCTLL
jgi:phosphoribosylformylglycinamidine synthase